MGHPPCHLVFNLLQESRNRLAEQQRRNLPDDLGPIPNLGFGMDDIKAASRKGLSATIQEMEGGEATSSGPDRPVNPDLTPTKELRGELESVRVKGDMISHLDNLEAEIWAVLEETENLNISSDPVANGGVSVGGAMPVISGAKVGEKIEVKKLADPSLSNKKVKVTSVQINVRRSSRSEEPRKVQSQPAEPDFAAEPVKQVTQVPKSETSTSKNNPPVVAAQEQQSVKLRHPRGREQVVTVKNVKKEARAVKLPEKTAPAAGSKKEPRRSTTRYVSQSDQRWGWVAQRPLGVASNM